MTNHTQDYRPQKVRWFLTSMFALSGVHATRHVFGEPAFVGGWSVEAKSLGLFAITFALFALLPLVVDAWSGWKDPAGYGAQARRPLDMFLESAGISLLISVSCVHVSYGKDLTQQGFPLGWALAAVIAISLAGLWVSNRRAAKSSGDPS